MLTNLVFEVISAKEGRRLYQATSEADMRVGSLGPYHI